MDLGDEEYQFDQDIENISQANIDQSEKGKVMRGVTIGSSSKPTNEIVRNHQKPEWDKTERFCDKCDFKATSEQAMKKHAISHLEAAVNCDICEKLFGSRTGLTLHMKKMHKEMQDEEKTLNDSTLLQVMFIF